MDRKPMPIPWLATAFAILAIATTVYGAAYFVLGHAEISTLKGWTVVEREYQYSWMPTFFTPAGWVEANLRHRTVDLCAGEGVEATSNTVVIHP